MSPIGFWDRIGDIASSALDVVGALPATVVDMVSEIPSLYDDHSFSKFSQAIGKDVIDHTGRAVEATFGPHGLIGAPVGALPEVVRQPVRAVMTPFNKADEYLYRNVIARPLTTLMTVGSYMSEDGQYHRGGWGGLFDPTNWRDAYKVSQSRTLGQAIFLAATTKNIEDQAQVAKASGSQAYSMVSGSFDMVARLFDDPANIAFAYASGLAGPTSLAGKTEVFSDFAQGLGKPVRAARTLGAKLGINERPVRTPATDAFAHAQQVQRALTSTRFDDLAATVDGWRKTAASEATVIGGKPLTAAEQRGYVAQKFSTLKDIKGDANARFVSDLVGTTRTTEELRLALGSVMGDGRSLAALHDLNPIAAGKVVDLHLQAGNADWLAGTSAGVIRDEAIRNAIPGRGEGYAAQVVDYNLETKALDLLSHEIRPPGALARWQDGIQSSEWYRSSMLGNVIQTIRKGSAAPHYIAVDAEGSHAQFASYIRSARVPGEEGRITGALRERHVPIPRTMVRVFDPTEEATLIGRYISSDPFGRDALLARVEQEVVDRYADAYKVPRRDVLEMQMRRETSRARQKAQLAQADAQRGTHYATAGHDSYVAEDGTVVNSPLFETQKVQRAPLQDWREVRNSLSKYSRWLANHPGASEVEAGMHAGLDAFMSTWKRGAIGRVGTGARIVTELQFRRLSQMAALGGFTQLAVDTATGVRDFAAHLQDQLVGLGAIRADERLLANPVFADAVESMRAEAKAAGVAFDEHAALAQVVRAKRGALRSAVTGGLAGGVAFGPPGAAIGALAGGGLGRRIAAMGDSGLNNFMTDGMDFGNIYGDTASLRAHTNAQISSMGATHDWLNTKHDAAFEAMVKTGAFEILPPESPLWASRWEHYVNNVIGRDPVGRLILKGYTPERVEALLAGKTGAKLIQSHFIRARITDPTAEQIGAWVDNMFSETAGLTNNLDPAIAKAALKGEAKATAWDEIIQRGEAAMKPSVAGEIVAQAYGKGGAIATVNRVLDQVIKFTSRLPEDDLARNPFFRATHRSEMTRMLDNLRDASGGLPELAKADMDRMMAIARRKSIKTTNDMMFDLADRSELSTIMRNWVPFFGASHEVVSTWLGIAHDNPAFANKIRLAWHGITEELPKEGDDPTRDPGPIFSAKDSSGRTVVRMRIPQWARWLAGHSILEHAFDEQGYITMDPRTVNLVTSGGLGFGPIVQIVASKMEQSRPDLESSLKFILPYGPSGSVAEALMPTWARRASSAAAGDADRAFATNKARIIATRLVKMHNGSEAMIDLSDPEARTAFLADVDKQANALAHLRTAVSALSPFSVSFSSPYQPYMDAYQKLITADPKTADQKFLDSFGDEFYALTTHVTRNLSGLPATTQGVATEKRFADLIAAYPTYGGVISGPDAGGSLAKFSSAAYSHQLATETAPGSGVHLRERLKPEEVLTDSDKRLGWNSYTRLMDAVDATLAERGLHSITQAAARDVLAIKQATIAKIAQAHPTWMADFLATDAGAMDQRVSDLTAIASDPRMGTGRDDMRGMIDYSRARASVVAALAQRRDGGGSGVLTAASNADVHSLWDAIVTKLRERNPAFAELHSRWLSRDLPAVPITVERKTA